MANKVKSIPSMFVYHRNGMPAINARFFNQTVWLTQKQMADLFTVEVPAISKHIKNIFEEGEIVKDVAVSKMEKNEKTGTFPINPEPFLYNLDVVIAVGYRVNSKKATEFRMWATKVLHEYIQKGFALDDERLKGGYDFDRAYFRELRERIKDIRVSERMLYQQLKAIYALSADYNHDKRQTLMFFAKVQNKVHFAITGSTSAELIYQRADATKAHMNLQTWDGAPDGDIVKRDIMWAKNYLTEPELKELKYVINMFLDFAEHKAEAEEPIFMKEWEQELDKFLAFNQKEILENNGKISRVQALKKASEEYGKYKLRIKQEEKSDSEQERLEDIKELEKILKNNR